MTRSGILSMNSANSARVIVWPEGLFGLHTKITLVRSVTAAAIASRSSRPVSVSSTGTHVAPTTCTKMG